MSFLIRSAEDRDVGQLANLARQFQLLNMPADEKILSEKIQRSHKAFLGKARRDEAEYVFVLEDTEVQQIVGCSLILGKHGTRRIPHNFYKVIKREKYSEELGVGFIHQVLQFKQDFDGPTEIGGLLVDRSYRRRPEKLGRQISLIRFAFMGLLPERFEKRVLCELTAPHTDEGRSEFWEALGRRFTGLNYQEADRISQSNKEFIRSLFPEDDIYMTLLDSRARLVLGRVGEATLPAKHLLESEGFQYVNEVDPFDGGPHFGCATQDIRTVREGSRIQVQLQEKAAFTQVCLLGFMKGSQFRGYQSVFSQQDGMLALPRATMDLLELKNGDEVFFSPLKL